MLALSYRGPKHVRIEEKPDPRVEHPNDVILRVTRSTICGSDLHLYHGYIPDTRVGAPACQSWGQSELSDGLRSC